MREKTRIGCFVTMDSEEFERLLDSDEPALNIGEHVIINFQALGIGTDFSLVSPHQLPQELNPSFIHPPTPFLDGAPDKNPPSSSPNGKLIDLPRTENGRELPRAKDFNKFWSAYPRKVAKPDAIKAWKKQVKVIPPIRTLLRHLGAWLDAYNPSGPEYIPYPATWLNRHRWDDELDTMEKSFLKPNSVERPILEVLSKMILGKRNSDFTQHEMPEAMHKVRGMRKAFSKLPKHSMVQYHLPTSLTFAREYVKWVEKNYEGYDNIGPKAIGPGSPGWDRFIRDLSKDIGVDLKSGKEMV